MYQDALVSALPEGPIERQVFSIDYGTMNAFAVILWSKIGDTWYGQRGYYYSGRDTGVQIKGNDVAAKQKCVSLVGGIRLQLDAVNIKGTRQDQIVRCQLIALAAYGIGYVPTLEKDQLKQVVRVMSEALLLRFSVFGNVIEKQMSVGIFAMRNVIHSFLRSGTGAYLFLII
jgi:hypothetical protein